MLEGVRWDGAPARTQAAARLGDACMPLRQRDYEKACMHGSGRHARQLQRKKGMQGSGEASCRPGVAGTYAKVGPDAHMQFVSKITSTKS